MTTEQIVGLALALVLMAGGTIGSVLPILPGTPIILAVAVGHRLYFGQTGASTWVLVVLAALTVLALVLDYLAGMIGAKKLGATWRGVVGAVLGGIIGIFFSFPGMLLGPFVGATLFELVGGREFQPAARAGLGATIGLVAGAVGKLSICLGMTLLFAASVIYRSAAATP